MDNISIGLIFGQLILGLINGAFYALLSIGLAIIFGVLRIANFAHGALFTAGAFAALVAARQLGVSYWICLVVAPVAVGLTAVIFERLLLSRLYKVDHLYGMLLTLGAALVVEGLLRNYFGSSGLPYNVPKELTGGVHLGFMVLPIYRGWVIVASLAVCIGTWLLIERTPLGARLRAATEDPAMVGAFGINVPLLVSLTYGLGAALAAFAGVLAAPLYTVHPNMGSELIIIVFAVVVIGGLGSIGGAIFTGFLIGIVENITRLVYAEGASAVVFVVMVFVLLTRTSGLFGKDA